MEPIEPPARSGVPISLKLLGIGVVAVAAWVALGLVFSIARAAIAALGYVVVAVIAYFIGKWVGRSEARYRDEP
jgi:hypothetical protein